MPSRTFLLVRVDNPAKWCALLAFVLLAALAGTPKTLQGREQPPSVEAHGKEEHGLRPFLLARFSSGRWTVLLGYATTVADKDGVRWLKPTNWFGGRLELFTLEGGIVSPTNAQVAATQQFPAHTSARDSPDATPLAFWPGKPVRLAASFDLGCSFPVPPTRGYLLRVTPVLYRAERPGPGDSSAKLVEFEPLELWLPAVPEEPRGIDAVGIVLEAPWLRPLLLGAAGVMFSAAIWLWLRKPAPRSEDDLVPPH